MRILSVAAIFVCVTLGWSAQPASQAKKAPPKRYPVAAAKRPAAVTSNRGTQVKPATAAKTPVARNSTAASRYRRPVVQSWRTRQAQPTPERYQEIQSALVAKGYLSQDNVNGAWGQASVDALKRFQADQKIDSSGKINSLSLIALGLGPHRESAPVPSQQ